MSKIKRIWIHNERDDLSIPIDPLEFIEFWKGEINKIPEEYMESGKIEITAQDFYDSPYLSVDLYYERPKTEEEIKREDKIRKESADKIERDRLKLYEELKEIYDKNYRLNPCPKCSKIPNLKIIDYFEEGTGIYFKCCIESDLQSTHEEAVDTWNLKCLCSIIEDLDTVKQ